MSDGIKLLKFTFLLSNIIEKIKNSQPHAQFPTFCLNLKKPLGGPCDQCLQLYHTPVYMQRSKHPPEYLKQLTHLLLEPLGLLWCKNVQNC